MLRAIISAYTIIIVHEPLALFPLLTPVLLLYAKVFPDKEKLSDKKMWIKTVYDFMVKYQLRFCTSQVTLKRFGNF